ncbi:MAG TPA: tannase/feruloyl esterase family alpha/beta hydrolase [Candidatus Acidoferrales bacterium]|nr:tannase/feruloyl esterase family alpha/beta hydrolase [Candidatus Acidoferrales bacterium]
MLIFRPTYASAQRSCESLANLTLSKAAITSATSVAAGVFKPPSGPGQPAPRVALPAFCRVRGVARPTGDSEIQFEVWLPASGWNGKFEQVGNGGFAGTIPEVPMAEPLLRGYATAATDDGHVGGTDVSWAMGHPEKVIDFGYRAVHVVSLQSKAIVRAFYGKPPAPSYFVGCSDGGREALMEAQRFPADFNGIVAGAPANDWTHLMFKALWDELAVGRPGAFIPPGKLAVLQKASLAACDSIDGLKDGLIENPQLCHFDPAVVRCQGADAPDCLTAPQVEAAKKIYGPVLNSQTGAEIASGFSAGAEAVPANWRAWITGANPGGPTVGAFFANAFFSVMVFGNPKMDILSLNFDTDVKLTDDKLASVLNAENPNLRAFQSRGGKLIQYAGWGDAAIPPQESVNYFERVQSAMGDTNSFYRLFMVPGMSHCGGGAGANVFGNGFAVPQPDATNDIVMALDRWVVHHVAPSEIVATRFVNDDPDGAVEMTRPLCPYPRQARYNDSGDPNKAASFTCRLPAAPPKR